MLILAVFVALVAVIVARVYEMIILHNGSRLKLWISLKCWQKVIAVGVQLSARI